MRFSPRASLDEIARRTEGYTGADLSAVARKAGLLALRRRDGAEEVGWSARGCWNSKARSMILMWLYGYAFCY